jgi:hypothetical protein
MKTPLPKDQRRRDPKSGELRNLIRQRNLFLSQRRDRKRYLYPPEIALELMPPTPAEERRMLAIIRAIKIDGEK